MKLSTLVSECQKALAEHGDMDVLGGAQNDEYYEEYPVQDIEVVKVGDQEWVLMLELREDE